MVHETATDAGYKNARLAPRTCLYPVSVMHGGPVRRNVPDFRYRPGKHTLEECAKFPPYREEIEHFPNVHRVYY